MEKTIFLLVVIGFFMAVQSTEAFGGTTIKNPIKMQQTIYGAAIDSKAAFYQKRIYLADSEFNILKEIGMEAVRKISYLKAHRQKIIDDMMTRNIQLKDASLNAFLGAKIRDIGLSMEAYSTE